METQQSSNFQIEYSHFNLPLDFPLFDMASKVNTISDKDVTTLHYHNCLEIGYCCSGAGVYFIDDNIIPFTQGDVSVIFKNQIHIGKSQNGNLSQWKFILISPEQFLADANIYDISLISDLANGRRGFINIITPDRYPEIIKIVQLINKELENHDELYQFAIRGLIVNLLINLDRIIKLTPNNNPKLNSDSLIRVAPALNYIYKNYMNPIRVTTLAVLCNCSVTYFLRLFLFALNSSPSEYIARVRIQMSTILLKNTNDTVLKISEKVGYDTPSCFNRQFKNILGVSPRVWSKQNNK